jgi:hypothetical protein
MTCRRIVLGRGTQAWSCFRPPARPPCSACGGPGGTLACGFSLRGARCGKALCRKCGGNGLCPAHQRPGGGTPP